MIAPLTGASQNTGKLYIKLAPAKAAYERQIKDRLRQQPGAGQVVFYFEQDKKYYRFTKKPSALPTSCSASCAACSAKNALYCQSKIWQTKYTTGQERKDTMADTPKRIGVLTSGGDAPGMNAAVRAVARTAINAGYEVIGFMRGYNGLVNSDYMVMNIRTVSDTIHRGGTLLYTARCEEFKTEQGVKKGASVCNDLNISGLVVIGGDGSFRGARDLTQYGIGCIGIPGTIDNDIGASQYSIGFDTAVNTVTEMVDKIRDTSQSHDRCTVVEVMGRRAGHIALHAGLATGATAVLVPEVKFDFERDIVKRIVNAAESGKNILSSWSPRGRRLRRACQSHPVAHRH